MNEEYLPPETESTALVPAEAASLATREDFVRMKCFMCSKENGMIGTRPQAMDLLERLGWKIGPQILCPDCLKKTARKFFARYSNNS